MKVLLVKYGEIALRGKNRGYFENKLVNTLRRNIKECEGYIVKKEQGRILVENMNGDVDYDLILPKVQTILGIIGFCPCVKTENQDIDALRVISLQYMNNYYNGQNLKFKVETRRANKNYPIPSQEVSASVGGYILHGGTNFTVDVHNPDITLQIELRNHAYIYSHVIKGFGGLPAGSSGKGTLLLSGGLDSPVAGFLMAKRGVDIEAVYFHSPPFTSEGAAEKVHDLAKRLSDFTGYVKLHIVNFTDIQTYLYEKVPQEKLTIFLKRTMLKIADEIGQLSGSQCLITGDSIGQVASQTLHAIAAVNSTTTLPIIRPLSGMDKEDIIDISKKIDTYEISIRPYIDCCTVFVAKHPEIRPKTSVIEKMEERLIELPEKIETAISLMEIYKY